MQNKKLLANGTKFNRLTVVKLASIKRYISPKGLASDIEYYLCKCDCDKETVVQKSKLIYSHTKSCGCLRAENMAKISTTHGLKNDKLYNRWYQIKRRCCNKNNFAYKNYGGRGIIMCDEWRNDFKAFHSWAMNNGYKKGLTIDRINNDGNYEPSNCRWATMKEQARNRRNNNLVVYKGKLKCLSELAEIVGIKRSTISWRINSGLGIEKALGI